MAVGKYDTHVKPKLLLVAAWARDGLTDKDISKNLDISVASYHNYKKAHLEFLESLKTGKLEADIIVENSLYKRALGYTYDEITSELVSVTGSDGKENKDLVVTKIVRKEVVADTTAQIFWLKNRKPGAWRDKQDIEHSGKMALDVDIERMDDSEILLGIEKTIQAINSLKARTGEKA